MASVQCGQPALLPTPKKVTKEIKLTDTVIAQSLRMAKNAVKENGMLVYKVNKVNNGVTNIFFLLSS